MKMKRKQFIYLSSLSALSLIVPIQSCSNNVVEEELEIPNSLTKVVDWDEMEAIGKEYLNRYPKEKDISILRSKIQSKFEKAGPMDLKLLRKNLRNIIENEFRNGEFLILHGWMVAKLEARQCALFYLKEKE